ncbi:hypothetical protein B9Z55_003698 [Caenorhabditis nigoni]|uniref:F-box domain-containing protein n=1 Tax=Caenorhabditis nigoni TaxID=1611254 RepID=A0A2G5VS39_9PELO|nr:hypothetical protein B9Z55_003698 [Caenorhabditis nigoni]
MPIAILKFPTDLLRDVLKQCSPFELYCLSKCSKRVRNSVKLGGEMKWKIRFWGWNEIIIYGDDWKYLFYCTKVPKHSFNIKYARRYTSMKIAKTGAVELFFYLLETFGICIVESLKIQSGNLYKILRIAEVLIEKNMEIEKFCIGATLDQKDVAKLMSLISQMKITKEFECRNRFPSNFQYQLDKYPDNIRIYNSSWFGINQLLNCTSSWIELRSSMLSNQDLNVFLQKWKTAGAFPNLRYLDVSSKSIDNQSAILDMIPPITGIANPRNEFFPQFDENGDFIMDNGVRIYKDDGTEARLKVRLGGVLTFFVSNSDNTVVKEMIQNYDEEEYEDGASDDEETEDEDSDDGGSEDEGADYEAPDDEY